MNFLAILWLCNHHIFSSYVNMCLFIKEASRKTVIFPYEAVYSIEEHFCVNITSIILYLVINMGFTNLLQNFFLYLDII